MALKPATATAPAQTAAFEPMDQPTQAAAPAPAPTIAASVPAVAKPSLPANAGTFKLALLDKQDVMTTMDIESLGFGAMPRVTADLGGLIKDDAEIGKSAKVEVISWNIRYMATTNSQDQEAKKLVRTSYDNKTISGTGESINDYIEALKAQGYEKASIKVYGSIWGLLTSTDKQGDIPVEEQQMVEVQLSPQSLQQFKRFQLEQGIREGRGLPAARVLHITAERKEFNGNRFGVMLFSAG